ncbi:RING finger protein 32-like [Lineus longissimus]|uniref:RING finger protein 32-like n=1 Tax=Lineus longissimus TaxID=88925 RepID=UPI002B4E272F
MQNSKGRGRGSVLPKSQTQDTTALTAVAFQDHLIRSLALTDALRPAYKIGRNIPTNRRQKNLKDVKSVLDTGRKPVRQKCSSDQAEKEYVLDPKPPQPTLAQKLGLVDAPKQLLTEDEWREVKATSNQREDSHEPCVICKEDYGHEDQVLLSCSHVFHKNCLKAFERFSGKKTCPMCRKEQYQTRVIHEGAKVHRQKCATMIQAYWRGHVVRSWYKKLRAAHPPKDPLLRRKFYEEKLQSITDRMVKSLDYNINEFFSEIDRNVQASRDVFKQFELASMVMSDEDWDEIQIKAVQRENVECPICLTSLTKQGFVRNNSECGERNSNPNKKTPKGLNKKSKTEIQTPGPGSKDTVLLSCTHVFHKTCIEAFEELAIGERSNSCPVCRSIYKKRVITL